MKAKPFLVAVGLALAAVAGLARAEDDAFAWTILRPDEWSSNYIGASPPPSRAPWLALVAGPHRWTLERSEPGWHKKTGGVSARLPGTLVFLRHGALQAGPAPTPEMKFRGVRRRLDPGMAPLRIAFGGDRYEIAVHDRAAWLEQGARRTAIGPAYVEDGTGDDFSVELIWAGDLDRDGRLDLITYESNGGRSADLCLYLSSASHPAGELLVKVGCEDWSG